MRIGTPRVWTLWLLSGPPLLYSAWARVRVGCPENFLLVAPFPFSFGLPLAAARYAFLSRRGVNASGARPESRPPRKGPMEPPTETATPHPLMYPLLYQQSAETTSPGVLGVKLGTVHLILLLAPAKFSDTRFLLPKCAPLLGLWLENRFWMEIHAGPWSGKVVCGGLLEAPGPLLPSAVPPPSRLRCTSSACFVFWYISMVFDRLKHLSHRPLFPFRCFLCSSVFFLHIRFCYLLLGWVQPTLQSFPPAPPKFVGAPGNFCLHKRTLSG